MKRRAILLLVCFCSAAAAQDPRPSIPDAQDFMRKTVDTYRAMSSYRDRGSVVQTLKASPEDDDPAAVKQEFVTLFKRPKSFKFAWTTTDNFSGQVEKDQDAIWSDGVKVWASWSSQDDNAPEVLEDFDTAVASATGVSHGMSHQIFALLSDRVSGFRLDMLRRMKILGSETAQGIDCYVVRGINYDKEVKLWIGKQDHLIRRGVETRPDSSSATFERKDIVVGEDIPDDEFTWHKQ